MVGGGHEAATTVASQPALTHESVGAAPVLATDVLSAEGSVSDQSGRYSASAIALAAPAILPASVFSRAFLLPILFTLALSQYLLIGVMGVFSKLIESFGLSIFLLVLVSDSHTHFGGSIGCVVLLWELVPFLSHTATHYRKYTWVCPFLTVFVFCC